MCLSFCLLNSFHFKCYKTIRKICGMQKGILKVRHTQCWCAADETQNRRTEGQQFRKRNKYAKRTNMQKEQKVEVLQKTHTDTHPTNPLFLTYSLSHSLFHSLCHPVSVIARVLASTRAGRCSKTSSHFVPALLYPSGCAFKFPHLLLFTLSSSRAGTLPKIHTCTHMHSRKDTHILRVSSFVLMTQFQSCVKPTHTAQQGCFFYLYLPFLSRQNRRNQEEVLASGEWRPLTSSERCDHWLLIPGG